MTFRQVQAALERIADRKHEELKAQAALHGRKLKRQPQNWDDFYLGEISDKQKNQMESAMDNALQSLSTE